MTRGRRPRRRCTRSGSATRTRWSAQTSRLDDVEWAHCDPGPRITDYYADGSQKALWPRHPRELLERYRPPKSPSPLVPPIVPRALVAALILLALRRRRRRVAAVVP